MVYTCCVPGCNTGYKSCKTSEKIPLFKFPSDIDKKEKWIKSIPRHNWTLSSSHRVCKLHFNDSDFVQESCDKKDRRCNARATEKLQRLRLKSSAVPHIFPNLPQYLSKENPAPRSTAATSSARLAKQNNETEESAKRLLQLESFDSFVLFKEKIEKEPLPNGYVAVFEEKQAWFHYISVIEKQAPVLLASVLVTETLKTQVHVRSAFVPHAAYQHLMPSKQLKSTTQFANILSLCKSLCDGYCSNSSSFYLLKLALLILEQTISEESTYEQPDDSLVNLLKFVIEQIKLIQVPKQGRRYSTDLLTVSFLWQITSTSLYKKLRQLLVLPSLSLLRKLSSGMTVESGKLDLEYLKLRQAELTQQEKIVVLMIDEVYTAQRVEYCNGSFIGVTEDGTPTKTVLAFMIQSLMGNYKDVVCLIPVNKLDTHLLRSWFDHVMNALDDFCFVVAVSTDNHVCNR